MERASLCLIVISSVRMHDFELAQQGVEEKQTVHNNHKKADWFPCAKVGEEQSQECVGEDEGEKNDAIRSHCAFTYVRNIIVGV